MGEYITVREFKNEIQNAVNVLVLRCLVRTWYLWKPGWQMIWISVEKINQTSKSSVTTLSAHTHGVHRSE